MGSGPDGSDSGTDDAGESTGEPDDGLMAAFVAQGSVGRTTVSCDDGLTWIHDRAYDGEGAPEVCDVAEPVVCWGSGCSRFDASLGECEVQAECDCDHHPGADKGIAFGHGVFAATWGWGPPGAIKTSSDAQLWTTAVEPTTFAGMAFGQGTFVAIDRSPMISSDGVTWVDGGPADFRNEAGEVIWNARDVGFAATTAGVFVAGASSGNGDDLMVSHDQGQSWTRPQGSWACGGDFEAVAGHGEVVVVVYDDHACRSADGGQSFEAIALGGGHGAVFDGERFVTWTNAQRLTSVDGEAWEATDLTIEGLPPMHAFQLGPVARSEETGTYVSVRGGWQQWYDAQDFYRSTDGVTWQALPAGSFVPSHRIRHIAYGRVDPSICE
ncbi:MAG: hypothetical protein KDK70_32705 [Myxococcales bacterium]|nr:hypothetical protein [Myxococcales bacterium]